MAELQDELEAAFEEHGYDVGEVSVNRGHVRVVLHTDGAEVDDLRSITHDVVDRERALGLNVAHESLDGQGEVVTVVSFRHRG